MPALDRQPAILVLADGTVFRGYSIGADAHTSGEVVFNTAMTGYQEILTDPSYCRQIVTLTYPHIGNVGVNPEDEEAAKVFAAGLVIRDLPIRASNFRSKMDLPEYLKVHGIPGIGGKTGSPLTSSHRFINFISSDCDLLMRTPSKRRSLFSVRDSISAVISTA